MRKVVCRSHSWLALQMALQHLRLAQAHTCMPLRCAQDAADACVLVGMLLTPSSQELDRAHTR